MGRIRKTRPEDSEQWSSLVASVQGVELLWSSVLVWDGHTESMLIARAGAIQWGDFATWAGALATLLAVVVALFLGLRPSWEERKRRPVIGVEVGEIDSLSARSSTGQMLRSTDYESP